MTRNAWHSPERPDDRPESHATDAPTLDKRIDDMEDRLALERAQMVAHARAFGGSVRRRMTSPTSLVVSASVGFLLAELMSARSRAMQRRGKSKAAGKSVFSSIMKPVLPLLRIGALGFFAKQSQDLAQTMEESVGDQGASPTLH